MCWYYINRLLHEIRTACNTWRRSGCHFLYLLKVFCHCRYLICFWSQLFWTPWTDCLFSIYRSISSFCTGPLLARDTNSLTRFSLGSSWFSVLLKYLERKDDCPRRLSFSVRLRPQNEPYEGLLDTVWLRAVCAWPTHKSGRVIGWVLQRQSDPLFHSVSVESVLTSYHMSIVCTLNVSKPKCPPTVMSCRKLKAIDTVAFHTDLSQILTDHPDMTITKLNAHFTSLLDKHAPVTKHIQKRKKITPWFPPEILVAERERRRAERAWQKSGLTVHKELFTQNK